MSKKTKKPIKIISLDIETNGFEKDVRTIQVGGGGLGNQWSRIYYPEEFEFFWSWFFAQAKKSTLYVLVHNLSFDIRYLDILYLQMHPQAPKPLLNLSSSKTLIIHGKMIKAKVEGHDIIFKDTMAMMPGSLEKVTTSYCLTHVKKALTAELLAEHGFASKHEFFTKCDSHHPLFVEYAHHDVLALQEAFLRFASIYTDHGIPIEKILQKATAPSLAMLTYKSVFSRDYDRYIGATASGRPTRLDGETFEFVNEAVFGGRTEVFRNILGYRMEKKHLTDEPTTGYHYDFGSLYPHVMCGNEYPCGKYRHVRGQEAITRYWTKVENGQGMAIVKAQVSAPQSEGAQAPPELDIPILPTHHEGKMLFPRLERYTGVWTSAELLFAVSRGYTIHTIDEMAYWPETYPVYENFIEYFLQIKETATGAKRESAKLMMNSLGGKAAQGKVLTKIREAKEGEEPDIRYHHERYVEDEMTVYQPFIQPHVNAFITANARILLYRAFETVKELGGNIYYCDTDSIVTDIELPADMVHPTQTGKLKLEAVIDQAIFLAPKAYYEHHIDGSDTKRLKGIPSELRKSLTQKDYERAYESFSRSEEFFVGEYYRPTSIKEYLRSDQKKTQVHQSKTIYPEREKRITDYQLGTTEPMILSDEMIEGRIEERIRAEEDRAYQKLVKEEEKAFRKAIWDLGGIRGIPSHPDIRRPYYRKTGYPLDVAADVLEIDMDELYEKIRIK